MYINITTSETGDNKGSSGTLVHYLEKENRMKPDGKTPPIAERWFNGESVSVLPHEVRMRIDGNIAKLGRQDSKFFLINVSPSRKELAHLTEKYGEDGVKAKLKEFAVKVMDEYARNFKRPGIESHKDLLWYGKLENYRYYSHHDKEVKAGKKQRGERKEGQQMHVQIIVSRKDITDKIKLSPQNTSRGKNETHSRKLGQFDRTAFKQSGETLFDELFGFDRNLKDSLRYANTLKNGTREQQAQMQALANLEQRHPQHSGLFNRISHDITDGAFKTVVEMFQHQPQSFAGALLDLLFAPVSEPVIQSDQIGEEERKRRKRRKKGQGQRR